MSMHESTPNSNPQPGNTAPGQVVLPENYIQLIHQINANMPVIDPDTLLTLAEYAQMVRMGKAGFSPDAATQAAPVAGVRLGMPGEPVYIDPSMLPQAHAAEAPADTGFVRPAAVSEAARTAPEPKNVHVTSIKPGNVSVFPLDDFTELPTSIGNHSLAGAQALITAQLPAQLRTEYSRRNSDIEEIPVDEGLVVTSPQALRNFEYGIFTDLLSSRMAAEIVPDVTSRIFHGKQRDADEARAAMKRQILTRLDEGGKASITIVGPPMGADEIEHCWDEIAILRPDKPLSDIFTHYDPDKGFSWLSRERPQVMTQFTRLGKIAIISSGGKKHLVVKNRAYEGLPGFLEVNPLPSLVVRTALPQLSPEEVTDPAVIAFLRNGNQPRAGEPEVRSRRTSSGPQGRQSQVPADEQRLPPPAPDTQKRRAGSTADQAEAIDPDAVQKLLNAGAPVARPAGSPDQRPRREARRVDRDAEAIRGALRGR